MDLYYDSATDTDMVSVTLARHHGHGTERVLYEGPVSGVEVSNRSVDHPTGQRVSQ